MVKIIFLGPPGSGKGTYSSRIGPELRIPHVSTGDLIRKEMKENSELGRKAKEYYEKGDLVPDELVLDLLKQRIKKPDCKNGFILDGFPRTLDQARALDKITNINVVINLYLPDDILIDKLSGRRVCRKCGDNYNVTDIKDEKRGIYMAPLLPKKEGVCDKCGGELYQRNDDKPKVIKERLEVYYQKTKPLIDYYTKKGILKQFNVNAVPDIMVPKIMELINS